MSQATDSLTAQLAKLAIDAANKKQAHLAHDSANNDFADSHSRVKDAIAAVQAEVDALAADSELAAGPVAGGAA